MDCERNARSAIADASRAPGSTAAGSQLLSYSIDTNYPSVTLAAAGALRPRGRLPAATRPRDAGLTHFRKLLGHVHHNEEGYSSWKSAESQSIELTVLPAAPQRAPALLCAPPFTNRRYTIIQSRRGQQREPPSSLCRRPRARKLQRCASARALAVPRGPARRQARVAAPALARPPPAVSTCAPAPTRRGAAPAPPPLCWRRLSSACALHARAPPTPLLLQATRRRPPPRRRPRRRLSAASAHGTRLSASATCQMVGGRQRQQAHSSLARRMQRQLPTSSAHAPGLSYRHACSRQQPPNLPSPNKHTHPRTQTHAQPTW